MTTPIAPIFYTSDAAAPPAPSVIPLRPEPKGNEHGGISLVMAGTMVLVIVLAYALVSGAAIAHARWRATIAADHAAIAGAHHALGLASDQIEPCHSAEQIARDNHSQLTKCQWDGSVMSVSVQSVISYGLFAGQTVRAQARAGPADVRGCPYPTFTEKVELLRPRHMSEECSSGNK